MFAQSHSQDCTPLGYFLFLSLFLLFFHIGCSPGLGVMGHLPFTFNIKHSPLDMVFRHSFKQAIPALSFQSGGSSDAVSYP